MHLVQICANVAQEKEVFHFPLLVIPLSPFGVASCVELYLVILALWLQITSNNSSYKNKINHPSVCYKALQTLL